MTTARVDWFTGTTYLDADDVLTRVHDVTDGAGFEVRPGRWMYGKRYVSSEGIEVLVDPVNPETMPPVCVNVPGSACAWLGAERVQRLAELVEPTRIDFAWDDVGFDVADVARWVRAGDMRTRLRSAVVHEAVMGADGNGVTIGTRNGTAQLVAYDRRGPVRLELRLRGERASAAYDVLMAEPGSWSGAFTELLRGVVDFVDRSQESRADRAPLHPSWDAFLDGAQRVVVALAGAVAPSLDRAAAWVRRQVGKTLHMLEVAGYDVRDAVTEGRRRMTRSDDLRMHAWLHGPPAFTPTL